MQFTVPFSNSVSTSVYADKILANFVERDTRFSRKNPSDTVTTKTEYIHVKNVNINLPLKEMWQFHRLYKKMDDASLLSVAQSFKEMYLTCTNVTELCLVLTWTYCVKLIVWRSITTRIFMCHYQQHECLSCGFSFSTKPFPTFSALFIKDSVYPVEQLPKLHPAHTHGAAINFPTATIERENWKQPFGF